jgi:hypothetical protein
MKAIEKEEVSYILKDYQKLLEKAALDAISDKNHIDFLHEIMYQREKSLSEYSDKVIINLRRIAYTNLMIKDLLKIKNCSNINSANPYEFIDYYDKIIAIKNKILELKENYSTLFLGNDDNNNFLSFEFKNKEYTILNNYKYRYLYDAFSRVGLARNPIEQKIIDIENEEMKKLENEKKSITYKRNRAKNRNKEKYIKKLEKIDTYVKIIALNRIYLSLSAYYHGQEELSIPEQLYEESYIILLDNIYERVYTSEAIIFSINLDDFNKICSQNNIDSKTAYELLISDENHQKEFPILIRIGSKLFYGQYSILLIKSFIKYCVNKCEYNDYIGVRLGKNFEEKVSEIFTNIGLKCDDLIHTKQKYKRKKIILDNGEQREIDMMF